MSSRRKKNCNGASHRPTVQAWQGDARGRSFDAGRTREGGQLQLPQGLTWSGDPSVASNRFGVAYYVCVAFNVAGGVVIQGTIAIYESTNGGLSWTFKQKIVEGQNPRPYHDKPYLAVNPVSTTNHNRIYVAWAEFTAANSQILHVERGTTC